LWKHPVRFVAASVAVAVVVSSKPFLVRTNRMISSLQEYNHERQWFILFTYSLPVGACAQ
jgi:hypothetical protein